MEIRRCTFHSNGTFFVLCFCNLATSDIDIRGEYAYTLCHQGSSQMLLAIMAATYLSFNRVQCGAVVLVGGSKNSSTQKTVPWNLLSHMCLNVTGGDSAVTTELRCH